MYLKMIYAFMSTAGFAVLFNIPRRNIIHASITGFLGWYVFFLVNQEVASVALASFLGALVVGSVGELFARVLKKPVTIFVIPGIIPLVPGYALYYTMLKIIDKSYITAANTGSNALIVALAIASGIIISSSFGRLYSKIKNTREEI